MKTKNGFAYALFSTRWLVLGIALLVVQPVPAMPPGYLEDFNGCSTEQDVETRRTCCMETGRDCDDNCNKKYDKETSPGMWVFCLNECGEAQRACESGNQAVPRRPFDRTREELPVPVKPVQPAPRVNPASPAKSVPARPVPPMSPDQRAQ